MKNKEKNFISAVVYVHDSESTLKPFLEKVTEVLSDNFDKFEVICVNDYSGDNSVEMIKNDFEKTGHAVSLINMSYHQGLEASMKAGVDLAIGDFVFEFDTTEMDFDPQVIMDIYRASLTGYDIVGAGPKNIKNFTSNLFYKVFNMYSNLQYSITSETFRILSRRAINRVNALYKIIPYRKAAYANCGLKNRFVAYETVESVGSIMKGNKQRKRVAIDALILFTDIMYRFSSIMTFIMMFIALSVGIYSAVVFFDGSPIEGWTTTMLFLSVGFFGIFMIFAMIVKYLSIILELSFKRQNYLIESIEKITK